MSTGVWRELNNGQPLPEGFVQFTAGGDYLPQITRVCTGCGAVVATDYVEVHRNICQGKAQRMIPMFVMLTEINPGTGQETGSILHNLSLVRWIATRESDVTGKNNTILTYSTDDVAFVKESAHYIGNLISDATEQM